MDDDPEVIRAEAEGKARVLEARAGLHPLVQGIYALSDTALEWLDTITTCVFMVVAIILLVFGMMAIMAPWAAVQVFTRIFGG